MFWYKISSLLLRCLQRDLNTLLRSGYNFLCNFIFLYNLKSSLKKIKSNIENINKSKEKILVDCYPNSLVYLYALLIHTFPTQKFFNSNCIIYCSNFSFTKSYLLSSLKNYEVFYLDSFIRNIFIILKNFKILKAEFIKIQNIEKNQFDYKLSLVKLVMITIYENKNMVS